MNKLTVNFSKSEFACSCGCGLCNVDAEFINKLQIARTIARMPFKIISGCRCKDCNNNAGGKPTSDHLASEDVACRGADIECLNSSVRFAIVSSCLAVGLNRIGIGNGFVHVGMRPDNPQYVMWVY